jgi:DNA-binding transcriptional regulator YiaG
VDKYILFPDDYKHHKGIPALPFFKKESSSKRPKPNSYPKELKTMGDHIRAWRLKNNLLQSDISKLLSVCEDTIVGWEMRNTKPAVRQIPGIIQLIGYLPIEIDISSFGGRIASYRYKYGLTPRELGRLLSVDASTIRAWERGKNTSQTDRLKRIEETLLQKN